MFGSRKRKFQADQLADARDRLADVEVIMRSVHDRLRALEDRRNRLPVEEIAELRAAVASKINAAVEAHAHKDGAGFPIKVE